MSDKITPPPVTPAAAPAQAAMPAPPPVVPDTKPQDEISFPEFNFNRLLEQEDAEANAGVAQPETPAAQPVDTTDVTRPVQPAAPVAEPAAEPTAQQPQPATPVAEAKPAAQPVAEQPAPQPRIIDPAERLVLDEGVEYTRDQIKTGLTNGVAAHQEASTFREVFRMSAAEAQQTWGPLIQEVDADPRFGEYLEAAIAKYRTETAAQQPAQPPADPVARKELADLKAWREQKDANERAAAHNAQVQSHIAAIETEKQTLAAQFPALVDPDAMTDLVNFALTRAVQDPTYTLTRAAHDRATYLSRLAPGQASTPAAAAAAVPALVGGGGPSPSGTTPQSPADDDDVTSNGRNVVREYMRERGLAR